MKILRSTIFIVLFLSLLAVFNEVNAAARVGFLIKGSRSSVYYYASDEKRYVFPTAGTFDSWFGDYPPYIIKISDEELATYPLGGNVTYRPGFKMVKITTDPKVYAVDKGGVLRWVTTEEIAIELYGDDWAQKIDDVPDAFFTNYTIGEPINRVEDINLYDVFVGTTNISQDKDIPFSSPIQSGRIDFMGIEKVPCEEIKNSVYSSIEELEGGLAPEGFPGIHWKIYFGEHEDAPQSTHGEAAFYHRYSDVGMSGTFTCIDNVIKVYDTNGKAEYTLHKYDSSTGILTWSGTEYIKEE